MNHLSEPFLELPSGENARIYEISNDSGMSARITDYGCTVVSLNVPDRNGIPGDIVTGYQDPLAWIDNPAYFGCIVGRVCNRVGHARFMIDGKVFEVTPNHNGHQLHGGLSGFNKKIWRSELVEEADRIKLVFNYRSVDGEEGYPGNLDVQVTYYLNNSNEFGMEFMAVTDAPTPVNLTNHCYFNLRGDGSGTIYDQELMILSDRITETDHDSIPTGRFLEVKNTPFDFNQMHAIGKHIFDLPKGYDDNYVLRKNMAGTEPGIRAYDPVSGRELNIFTSEPGVQLYTSNWFDGSIIGKSGKPYLEHHAFALETQHFPDSVNHPEFPGTILRPGEVYRSETIWKFAVRD